MSSTIRLYPALDIGLLKEVAAINPYGKEKTAKEWEAIVENVNRTLNKGKVTLRGCKDRMKTLLKAHRKAEMQSLKASGTEEEYTERDALLTEVDELCAEAAKVKEEKKGMQEEEKRKEEQGKDIREAAMQFLKRPGDTDDGSFKRPKNSGARASLAEYLEVLREKNATEAELKFEQLRLDRERFNLEKQEREQRMERDAATIELLKTLIVDKKNQSTTKTSEN